MDIYAVKLWQRWKEVKMKMKLQAFNTIKFINLHKNSKKFKHRWLKISKTKMKIHQFTLIPHTSLYIKYISTLRGSKNYSLYMGG